MSIAGTPTEALVAAETVFAGRYVVADALAWNGLAFVFRAVEPGRAVAVAAFPGDRWTDERRAAGFLQRARLLQELRHPALVPVRAAGIEGGVPFVEMERVEGPTLAEVVRQEGPLARDRAFRVASEVLDALEVLHDQRVMHWDLAPSNVILEAASDGTERVRIVGVGFRLMMRSAGRGRASGPEGARYVAPEVWKGAGDGRSDQYAVGALLHWMLTARAPRGPGGRGRGTGWARPVVARALASRPHERFADVRSMRLTLTKAYEGQPVAMPGVPGLRRKVAWGVAGVVCLGVGIVGGAQLRTLRASPSPAEEARPAQASPLAALLRQGEGGAARRAAFEAVGPDMPEALREADRRIRTGERLSREELAPLQAYARAHKDDARGHLLLGHAFAALGWRTHATERYLRAHQADPNVRRDARVLDELLVDLLHPDLHEAAARALSIIYGDEAIEAGEDLLASGGLTWVEQQRVRKYVERLKGKRKRSAAQRN
jgi:hypothetical protein